MTDFSPVEGALIEDSALLVLVGRVVGGSSIFGSADESRVNMNAPDEICLALSADAPPQRLLTPRFLWSSKFADGRVALAGTVAIMARVIPSSQIATRIAGSTETGLRQIDHKNRHLFQVGAEFERSSRGSDPRCPASRPSPHVRSRHDPETFSDATTTGVQG